MVKQKQEGDRKALRREIRSVKHRVAISTDQKKIITLPIILPVKQTGLSSVCITTDKWTCEQHFVERFIYTIMKEQNKVFLVWSMEFSLFISLFLRFFLGRKRDSSEGGGGREREGLPAPPVGGETGRVQIRALILSTRLVENKG